MAEKAGQQEECEADTARKQLECWYSANHSSWDGTTTFRVGLSFVVGIT